MKKLFSFFIIFSLFFLSACKTVTKKEMILSSIDTAVLSPQDAFLSNNNLYISYVFDNALFYFTTELEQQKASEKTLYLKNDLNVLKDFPEAEESTRANIVNASVDWASLLKGLAEKIAPQEAQTAVLLITEYRELVFFRDEKGQLVISEIKLMPKNIRIVGHYDPERIKKDVLNKLKEELHTQYPGVTKFLIPLPNIPRTPFAYMDLENNVVSALILPDYYQLKKDMSSLGFTVEFIYSFFVKSHFFAIIKSPVTSLHRLFTTTTKSIYSGFHPKIENIEHPIAPVNTGGESMDVAAFEKYLDKKVRKDKYQAKTTLLIDGEEFFPHFLLNAKRAQKNIFVRLYIFTTDPYSLSVADMLKEKSNEGVDVRVLVDELNTVLNWTKVPEQPYDKNFVMPSIKKYLKRESGVSVRTHLNTWVTFDHSKVIVIDDHLAYTGGMNFGEDYRYSWHDMMLALEGPFALAMKEKFKYAWAFSGWGGDFSAAAYALFKEKHKIPAVEDKDMIVVRPLYTRPGDSEIFKAQREAIRRAQKRIYIQNAYFSDNRIVKELIEARKRGVDVRVILPGKNDITLMYKQNMVKANLLLENGIRVYEYPKMSHVKAAIYDDWACVGSANFDKMSLFINQEMSLGISDPSFVEELNTRLFQKDFSVSKEITQPFDLSWTYYITEFFAKQA